MLLFIRIFLPKGSLSFVNTSRLSRRIGGLSIIQLVVLSFALNLPHRQCPSVLLIAERRSIFLHTAVLERMSHDVYR